MPNIQIFGRAKCFDSKKAERYFKERGIRFQAIDLPRYGMSRGELCSVIQAVGGIEKLINDRHPDAAALAYLAPDEARVEKLLDDPKLLCTPIVRNGKLATVGHKPEVWGHWLAKGAAL